MFTEGAKGKFLKQLAMMRERPTKIKELQQCLEVSICSPFLAHFTT